MYIYHISRSFFLLVLLICTPSFTGKMQATIYIGLLIIVLIHTSYAKKIEDSNCLSTIKSDGISLINHGITLLNPSIKISGRFFEALQDLYNMDNRSVIPTLLNHIKLKLNYVLEDFELYKDIDLDKAVIYTYTDGPCALIEWILDHHRCGKKILAKREKKLAPLAAYVMAVLLYSPNVPKETNLTYVRSYQSNFDQLKVGTAFLWTSFDFSFESAVDYKTMSNQKRSTIIINNSQESMWSPRRIEQYSLFPEDKERVYPPGAMLRVTEKRRRGQEVYIYADLISED